MNTKGKARDQKPDCFLRSIPLTCFSCFASHVWVKIVLNEQAAIFEKRAILTL
jgi:hypothetical protein